MLPPIRIISRQSIEQAVSLRDFLDPVAKSLMAYSAGEVSVPPIGLIHLPQQGEVHIKSGYIRGGRYFVTKTATTCPANLSRGSQASSGLVLVFDAQTGYAVALLQDDALLTDLRTAAVGAIAARLLSDPQATTVGVLGTGVQARLQVLAVALVRKVSRVLVWGRDAGRAAALAGTLRRELPQVEVNVAPSVRNLLERSAIVVTSTATKEPLIQGEWLKPGQHITAIGADDEFKCELDADCFARATQVFVDSRELALRYGDVAKAIQARTITKDAVAGELGEILLGKIALRRAATGITISKHVGIGIEDVAAAEVALQKLSISI